MSGLQRERPQQLAVRRGFVNGIITKTYERQDHLRRPVCSDRGETARPCQLMWLASGARLRPNRHADGGRHGRGVAAQRLPQSGSVGRAVRAITELIRLCGLRCPENDQPGVHARVHGHYRHSRPLPAWHLTCSSCRKCVQPRASEPPLSSRAYTAPQSARKARQRRP